MMDHREVLVAAMQLQRDAALILNRPQLVCSVSTPEIYGGVTVSIRPQTLPCGAVEVAVPVPHVFRASTQMAAMGLWHPPGGPVDPGPAPVF